jgi:hypothetical protein
MKLISPLVHRCIVPDGDMAGSRYEQEVGPYDIEFEVECEVCKKRLATPAEAVAHIYGELLP